MQPTSAAKLENDVERRIGDDSASAAVKTDGDVSTLQRMGRATTRCAISASDDGSHGEPHHHPCR